jgi:flavin-binding protein dodecin
LTLAQAGFSVPKEPRMKNHVYKLIELTGTSTTSIEDAIARAIQRAHKTIKNLSWFQVVETRGNIDKGKVDFWQVTIKVGFTVEG